MSSIDSNDISVLSRFLQQIPQSYTEPFTRAWRHRELIRAVARREYLSRYSGAALGWVWAVLAPLVVLGTYTSLFYLTVPELRGNQTVSDYAGSIFIGLIVFNLFSELGYRSPMLLHEHVNFVKRSIFPSETIAWTAAIRAFIYSGISFGVYIGFRLFTVGHLPWTIILTPLAIIPFALFMLGLTWFLMALGAFTRDVSHIMASIVPLLMFATPIFYRLDYIAAMSPMSALLMRINLIGDYVEIMRDLAFDGRLPNFFLYTLTVVASYAVFIGGYRFFMRYKSVIVDVI
jgi:lipopolysaccharide transport system permease protein